MQELKSEVQYRASNRATPVLRDLAASGSLREAASTPGECAKLRSAAFEVALPLVWTRHTRPLENSKGHRRCASGIIRLAPECHDGFTDDLESVVTALLSYGRPIANLEGWISTRMSNAIKDGHRLRRAREMGAQQRVRVPARLAARLDNDPWLVALAERVLRWAGVRHTAGTELWPLHAWAEDRAAFTGPSPGDPHAAVARDLGVVLRTMRDSDSSWFEKYVERPLGRKWAPVVVGWPNDDGADRSEVACFQFVSEHERTDAHLAEAAARSLTMIRSALAAGTGARNAIAGALAANFMSIGALRAELDREPGADGTGDVVAAILNDCGALDRLVPDVLTIVGQR
jgi:hypothetical protein